MLVVRGAAIVVRGIARRRVGRIDQRHVALTAFNRYPRIALFVPVAGGPVVVLILQLDPAHAVHLPVDKLLVAGCAVLPLLVHAFAEAGWVRWRRAGYGNSGA